MRGVPLRLVYASLWERYAGVSLSADLGRPSDQLMTEEIVATAERRARRRRTDVEIFTDVLPEEPDTPSYGRAVWPRRSSSVPAAEAE